MWKTQEGYLVTIRSVIEAHSEHKVMDLVCAAYHAGSFRDDEQSIASQRFHSMPRFEQDRLFGSFSLFSKYFSDDRLTVHPRLSSVSRDHHG